MENTPPGTGIRDGQNGTANARDAATASVSQHIQRLLAAVLRPGNGNGDRRGDHIPPAVTATITAALQHLDQHPAVSTYVPYRLLMAAQWTSAQAFEQAPGDALAAALGSVLDTAGIPRLMLRRAGDVMNQWAQRT